MKLVCYYYYFNYVYFRAFYLNFIKQTQYFHLVSQKECKRMTKFNYIVKIKDIQFNIPQKHLGLLIYAKYILYERN